MTDPTDEIADKLIQAVKLLRGRFSDADITDAFIHVAIGLSMLANGRQSTADRLHGAALHLKEPDRGH